MANRLRRWSFVLVVALLHVGVAQGQVVSAGDLVVTDLFGFGAPNLSVFDSAGASSATFDLLFCSAFDVEVDPAGEIFVSTGQTAMLFQLAPGASPDCIAVGDTGGLVSLGIALAPSGVLFVIDGNRVVEVDPTAYEPGNPSANREVVGSGGDLTGANDVAAGDAGLLFVATTNGPVVRLDPDTYDPGDPAANQTRVGLGASSEATDIAIGPTGELFVAEVTISGSRVVRYDPDSYDPLDTSANQLAIYSGGNISLPASVAFDAAGRLLVLDEVGVIQIDVASGAQTLRVAGSFGVPFAKLAVANDPAAVPALGATLAAILAALLCAAAWWRVRAMNPGVRATLARFAIALTLLCSSAPEGARAEALDLFDPTPRPILVEFEISPAPATIGQSYSVPFDASYSATGNTGTVVISAADYEAAIELHGLDYFDTIATTRSLVSGSASSFTLEIDLVTLEATAQTFTYQVLLEGPPFPFPQVGTVTRDLSTTTTAGFAFVPPLPPTFPLFCTPCFPVPGAPYDPITGKLNAVGPDDLSSPDFDTQGFALAGDLRLSESPIVPVPSLSTYALSVLALALAGAASLALRGGRPGPRTV